MPLIEVAGRKVYYERHEPSTPTLGATPLLLIAGASGSCRGWLPLQVPEFSKTRPTIIFDNRGAGQSDDPGTPFTTAELAVDTVGLLDALEIERADVLGVFMGGMVAQELALQAPERVHRLVLVGTYARPDARRRMMLTDWAARARAGADATQLMKERLVWTLQDETLEQTDLIEGMVDFFEKEGAPTSADLLARQCDACTQHDTLDRLREIPHPTLVICGRQDLLTPPKFHRELADEIPDAQLVTLSYGAHLVMVESAERFNQVVLQFLSHD